MLRLIVGGLVLIIARGALSDDRFFLYQDDGKIKVVWSANGVPVESTAIEWWMKEPAWEWENSGSRGLLYQEDEGIHIHWSINIRGPHWLYLDLIQNDYGTIVNLWHSNEGYISSRWYESYDALVEDDSLESNYVKTMMDRVQPLLHLSTIRCITYGYRPPTDVVTEEKCRKLITLLGDQGWAVRCKAEQDLSKEEMVIYLPTLTKNIELEPEQESRLYNIMSRCMIRVNVVIYEKLTEVVRDKVNN